MTKLVKIILYIAGTIVPGMTAMNAFAQTTDSYEAAVKKHTDEEKEEALKHRPIKVAIGDKAMDFTINDLNDHPVSLSSFKGKYVLVDFWASWCHPCRAENPNVIQAYNKFKDKGFTVLSVSLDGNKLKSNWIEAVQKDSLSWTQVNEPAGFNQETGVGKLYDIRYIPQNFLIDPDGKVLFIDLRGEALQQALASLLK